tara:strand:+ start:1519 stop:3489 length:1971 start_codon:yes stop_codon:yes gene_type:complete
MHNKIFRIAINTPFFGLFEYLPSVDSENISVGNIVKAKFKNREVFGVVHEVVKSPSISIEKLKPIVGIHENNLKLDEGYIKLISWVSKYYHYPIGQTYNHFLPKYIEKLNRKTKIKFEINEILLQKKSFKLSDEQKKIIKDIQQKNSKFSCNLISGVTGSGKTEIYKQIANKIIKENKQVLVLVPEINLIPQIKKEFQEIGTVVTRHSNMSEKEKYLSWHASIEKKNYIFVGTRSCSLLPFSNLGLIIVDEEHDLSYKQEDHLKYNARDLSIYSAQMKKIPIILGSATPSFETILNVKNKKYSEYKLNKRVKNLPLPKIELVNMINYKKDLLAPNTLKSMKEFLNNNDQVMLFINRRGYSPVVMCTKCSWIPRSPYNNIPMTYHKNSKLLICHHSGYSKKFNNCCPVCSSQDFAFIGKGTERIGEVISEDFKKNTWVRIDSDSFKKKGELDEIFKKVSENQFDILVGTQMLSKGHNFKNLSLVVVVDVDQRLYSPNLKALEHLAQLLIQVSGRAGRVNKRGKVLIQTNFPNNSDLQYLFKKGYDAWALKNLESRKKFTLPPYINTAIIRAKGKKESLLEKELLRAKETLPKNNVKVYGPMSSSLPKKGNEYNMYLMLQSKSKGAINKSLSFFTNNCKNLSKNNVKFSIDVDPVSDD